MRTIKRLLLHTFFPIACMVAVSTNSAAQMDIDALFMNRGELCTGPMYSHQSWKNYWEGTLKRDNLNLGRVSTQTISLMGMYGFTKKLNLFYHLPYTITSASAGQWAGQSGLQDVSLWLKYRGVDIRKDKRRFSLIGLLGLSTPLSNYSKDMLPLSLGLGSTNLSARLMADVAMGKWFATASATYVWRSNVTLDRTAYFTTRMHYTNEVEMPNATQWNIRTGYRTGKVVAEIFADNWTTRGGFDISRNNMPFISNRMNATRMGVHLKHEELLVKPLTLMAGGSYTLAGRNVGETQQFYAGAAWLFQFGKNNKTVEP